MRRRTKRAIFGFALGLIVVVVALQLQSKQMVSSRLRAVLLKASDLSPSRVEQLKTERYNAVVLELSDSSDAAKVADRAAADQIHGAGLDLYYWIEIARHAPTADAHPERMASLQGHGEWRRLFPKARTPRQGEVTKVYPWTPILYSDNFDAHLARVTALLQDRPSPKGILLNDLQAAPSACGCGNLVCRWTTDYGPIQTAKQLNDDAAALFVAAVARQSPNVKVIPVWTSECELHDKETMCAGVACYEGLCWKRYAAQLAPLTRKSDQLGVLCLYKEFGQDTPYWSVEAGWVEHALRTFEKPLQNGPKVSTSRLVAVLQGWNVSDMELEAQIIRSESAGVGNIVVAETRIEQGWEPRVVSLDPKGKR